MTRTLTIIAVVLACAGASQAATTYPDRWLTVAEATTQIKSKPLWVLWCPPRTTCIIASSTGYITGYQQIQVKVATARARGIAPRRLVAGNSRFHEFDVTVCVVNYQAGGARTGLRVLWNAGKAWPGASRLALLEKEYAVLRDLVLSGRATAAQKQRARDVLSELNVLRATAGETRAYPLDWYSRAMPRLRNDSC